MKRLSLAAVLLLVVPTAAMAQQGGVIGGSSVAQWLIATFAGQVVQTTSKTIVGQVLTIWAPLIATLLSIVVVFAARRAMFGAISMDEIMRRSFRMVITVHLVAGGGVLFNNWVTQPLLNNIPTAIVSTGTGNQEQSVGAAFDGEYNRVTNFTERLENQAAGWSYIPERIIIWVGGLICKLFITINLFVYICAFMAVAFMIPAIALLMPLWLFDFTAGFFYSAVSSMVGLFLVMAFTVWVSAFVTIATSQYMTQYLQVVQAAPPSATFQANAGDAIFTSLGIAGDGIALAPTAQTQVGDPTTTANVNAAIEAIFNLAIVTFFGAIAMALMVKMSMSVASAGFSMRGPVNTAARAASAAAQRIRGK